MEKINKLAKDLFGDMRNLTEEEQECLYEGLNKISEDTGIALFDYIDSKLMKKDSDSGA